MRWTQIDPGGWVIKGLEKLGLAWNVVRISAERQAEKSVRQPTGV
jgi:stearoyl-CoA desaturase (delta-9 desaturase)